MIIEIDEEYILEIKKGLSELPDIKEKYYRSKYGFTDEQINIILSSQDNAKFIDEVLNYSKIDAKKIVNYFIASVYSKINKESLLLDSNLSAKDFCLVLDSLDNGMLSKNNLKSVVDDLWGNKESVLNILDKYQINNEENYELIDKLIKEVIDKNEKQVKEYKSGKTKILGFFIGQILKESKGSDPSQIKDKIIKALESIWKNRNSIKT